MCLCVEMKLRESIVTGSTQRIKQRLSGSMERSNAVCDSWCLDIHVDLMAGLVREIRRNMDTIRKTVKITPLEMYDPERAKIAASLHWLFAKAYGIDHIPEDMQDPFYTDQYKEEQIKPLVIRLLLSSELYCRVCGLILKGDQSASLQSHQSVFQALAHKGIYVEKQNGTHVTDGDLRCQPMKVSSHMSMIDALMMAYTVEMISIEKVVTCVKRFSTVGASKELPLNVEEAMIFWINKVNLKMREISEKENKVKQHLLDSPSHQKVRYSRKHASGRQLPHFTLLEDLTRDVCDGAALLTVVHYYCPDLMKLHDICLKEVISTTDRLYNIQLLKEFANDYLNKSFYLTLEDMLYSPPVLKHNVMVFIAELFWWFEILKPEFVHPRDMKKLNDARAVARLKRSWLSVAISNATKRSFLASPGMANSPHPVPNIPQVCNSPSCRLLPQRPRQERPGQTKGKSDRLPQFFRLEQLKNGQKLNVEKEQSSKHDSCLDAVPTDAVDEEKKTGTFFFFKDEQKTDEEMAKKRAALLLKQQKRAEEARLLKQQLEAERELKRAEARRKAEQEQLIKEDDEARRELIKQEHLKSKYQWQNSPNPKPKPKKQRPKSVLKKKPLTDTLPKVTTATFPTGSEGRQRGSTRRGGTKKGPRSSASRRPPCILNRTFSASSSSDLKINFEPESNESARQTYSFKPTITSSVKSFAEQSPGVCTGQRLKLKKAALLPVITKGRSPPQTFKLDQLKNGQKINKEKEQSSKHDSCPDAVPTDAVDEEKKTDICFFFKDEQKTEDEMAKKRAAFLLKQQKKADEAQLCKQQLEAEGELKRTEARRKAEEECNRKVEDKARRELIKQHLKSKYQGQNPSNPNPNPKPKKQRPKYVLKKPFTDTLPKVTPAWCFKKPTGKSNKQTISNAICHCCLAGKVNEPQKITILEEIKKCESNHLMILFRDGGCQFRALYSYFPDTEEIHKLTGRGPKIITKEMIDKLYKYNSHCRQFSVIPAKMLSVIVDALTIHNNLWQAKRRFY